MAPIRTSATEGGVMLDETDTRDARASAVSSLSEGKMETRCRFEKIAIFLIVQIQTDHTDN